MFQAPKVAVLRGLSTSFAQCVTSIDLNAAGAINMQKAQEQHERYTETVRACVEKTVEVESDSAHPDCCFVEDTLVVCGATAVVNSMGHQTRRGEVGPVRAALSQVPAITNIRIMTDEAPGAHIDGGDVLTMPGHQFVGLSNRSNLKGVEYLRSVFSTPANNNIQVHAIDMLKITGTTLHLKCLVSALNQSTIVVADNPAGRAVFEEMKLISGGTNGSDSSFLPIYVPDEVAANVLAFPWALPQPTVVVQANFPESEKILRASVPDSWKVVTLDMSELIKADGALTCCSVLI
ncbi:N(G),N(G)-dimethylarginine dimethylaminohydrolase 1 [Physocladia obscura]|uniref:N(G),N(G)-dimethylarginine dimethylaminohydrolase 1 n=1 Tax=Physocladia obscura TaxID=109957 RepID=A0AAD5XIC2_9FUNG|nr:N(G),N(G)-dimethylarginine dimethylaminohydrolase 1 [Physocladia obscura]